MKEEYYRNNDEEITKRLGKTEFIIKLITGLDACIATGSYSIDVDGIGFQVMDGRSEESLECFHWTIKKGKRQWFDTPEEAVLHYLAYWKEWKTGVKEFDENQTYPKGR